MRNRWILAGLLGAVVPLAPGEARAQSGNATEPIRIEYHAEPGCPSADEFNTQVFRRTASARLATSGDAARTFIVSIGRRGHGLTGSLFIRQADGTTESREVAGPDCGEVAKVLALATALAIDPQASLSVEPEPDRAPAPPLTPPASEPAASARPTSAEPELPAESGAPWSIALGPSLEAAVAPRVAFGGTLELGWRPRSVGPISAAGVELWYLRTAEHHTETAKSVFQYYYVRPSLCSVVLRWQEESGIAPCVAFELGAVTGTGSHVPVSTSDTRLWAAGDLGLRLFQTLGPQWFVEADGSIVLPFTRYEYVFTDPDTHVYSVPGAASAVSLRLGARLW
ncbi:MAG TPA: hypothetical protein VGQ57_07845 [Polyangiaceae bacterium]|nr:hypothetical protein [Polyangiaceae bacterium]